MTFYGPWKNIIHWTYFKSPANGTIFVILKEMKGGFTNHSSTNFPR